MRIADLMNPVPTVPPETPLAEVARRMADGGSGCVVVVNPRGQAQGVLTVRDFVPHDPGNPFNPELAPRVFGKSILRHGLVNVLLEARVLTAGRMMRPLNVVLAEDDPVERAVDLMLRHDDTHLPVLRGHQAVGCVSRRDLVKLVVAVCDGAIEPPGRPPRAALDRGSRPERGTRPVRFERRRKVERIAGM